DYNDEIRQEQLRELSFLNGSDETTRGRTLPAPSSRTPRPAFSAASRVTRPAALPPGTRRRREAGGPRRTADTAPR
ncbi:hypothetical protein CRUP_017222, partial [Coryphaenoides rupestris]